MPRPDDGARCSNCGHPFGSHYMTFDGRHFGCQSPTSGRTNAAVCRCPGYMTFWRPEAEQYRAITGNVEGEVVG